METIMSDKKRGTAFDNFKGKANTNGIQHQDSEKRKEIAAMGGSVPSLETRFKDGLINNTEYQEGLLEEVKEMYIIAMNKDAAAGDFKKMEFWEKATGKNKVFHKEEAVVKDNNINITVDFKETTAEQGSEEDDTNRPDE